MAFDKNKILTMTKLALYDKHEGYTDRMTNNYYRHDYIYGKNVSTRFAVGFCGLILLMFHWVQIVLIQETDIFDLDFRGIAIDSILFLIALMAVYSVIGTIQGTREYYNVQKRLEKYRELVIKLDTKEETIVQEIEDDEEMYIPPQNVRRRPNIERRARTVAPPSSSRDDPRRQASRPRPTRPTTTTRTVRPPGSSTSVRIPPRKKP